MVNENNEVAVDHQTSSSADKFNLLECGKRLAMTGKFEQSFECFEKCCSMFAIDKDANLKEYLSSHYFFANALLEYCQNLNVEANKNGSEVENNGRKRPRECIMCSETVPCNAVENSDGGSQEHSETTAAKQGRLEDDEDIGENDDKNKNFLEHSAFLEEIDNLLSKDINNDEAIDSDSQSESFSESDQSDDGEQDANNDDDVTSSTHPKESNSNPCTSNCEDSESPLLSGDLLSRDPSKPLLQKSISLLEFVCNNLKPIINNENPQNSIFSRENSTENTLSSDFCIRLYGIALYKLGVAKAEASSEIEELEKIFDDSIRVLQLSGKKDHFRISEVSFTGSSVSKSLGNVEKAQKLLEFSIAEMKTGITLVESELAMTKDESEQEFLSGKIENNRRALQEIENHLTELKKKSDKPNMKWDK